jgi:hypothetical protein
VHPLSCAEFSIGSIVGILFRKWKPHLRVSLCERCLSYTTNCWWSSPAKLISDSSPAVLMIIFCCIRFETPPTWRARSPYLSPRNRVAQLYPQVLGSLFVVSYDSRSYGGYIRTHLRKGIISTKSKTYVTTDGQSASLFWCQSSICGPWPDLYYCQTSVGLLMWGAHSDERTDLHFTIAAGSSWFS